jgi:(2Fe-2S) ferredoxin
MNIELLFTNCHTTEKSEANAVCKELPVIPVYKKRIIGKRTAKEEAKAQEGFF